jgi:hypothetical protein
VAVETATPVSVGRYVPAKSPASRPFDRRQSIGDQEAAIEFLNQTIRPRYDQALVIGFDLTPKVTQDFTRRHEKLSVAIRAMRPGTLTAMYDVLYYACRTNC